MLSDEHSNSLYRSAAIVVDFIYQGIRIRRITADNFLFFLQAVTCISDYVDGKKDIYN